MREEIVRAVIKFNPVRYTATVCGHKTRRIGDIDVFGEKRLIKMSRNEDGSVRYCLDCIGKMSIRCGWCGEPIIVGEMVTLYIASKEYKLPPHAVFYDVEKRTVVGCERMNCAGTGSCYVGRWLPGDDGTADVSFFR